MSIEKGSLIAAADMSDFSSIPTGVIVMWSGASDAIPTGWVLCDGNNNTPNLVDRFIVGAGSTYTVGATGGSNTVTLTTAQMPSHTHTFTGASHNHSGSVSLSGLSCSSAGEHTHAINSADSLSDSDYNGKYPLARNYRSVSGSYSGGIVSAGAHTHSITGSGTVTIDAATAGGTNSNTGSGSAHENRPPYYALCFIMKT